MEVLGQSKQANLSRQRFQLKRKVLQFGEGNFLRAFVDWMFHEMNHKADFNAAVTVIQPIKHGLADQLKAQDGLYNVYLNGFQNGEFVTSRDLIDVITESIDPYENFNSYLNQATNPDLKFIVSNTTEAGIQFDPKDSFGDRPASSFPGKLTQLFFKRFKEYPNADKLFILPCELIDRNGLKLRDTVLQYVDHWRLGLEFKNWLSKKALFYNTLVDRIVPGYPKERDEKYWKELGYKDHLLVEGEIFYLWVIEGSDEIKKALPTVKSGLNVIFTNDLDYYRTRKVRILNGAHTCMVPVAYLYGLDFVQESVENELIGSFIRQAIFNEIIPSLDGERAELQQYANEVIDRFKNPSIRHALISIALNSFSKFKTRVMPSILSYYKKEGKLPRLLTTALAALICFYKGRRFDEDIELMDEPQILKLMESLWSALDDSQEGIEKLVTSVLGNEELWGQDLTEIPGFNELVSSKVYNIQRQGMGKVVQSLF
ncbi:MAG: tagaturonate reductase [Bacteroidota bacterium]